MNSQQPPSGVQTALRIVARQTTYKLDLGGRSSAEFHQLLDQLQARSARFESSVEYPAGPAVDLDVEIINTGAEECQILLGGTYNGMTLELKGPGAVSFAPREAIPAMACPPATIPLALGAKYVVAVRHLPSPLLPAFAWGRSLAYWTAPGPYTLTAVWNAGISPPPPGSRDDGNGFGHLTLSSEPITLNVV
jgi:hypothetical protein